MTKKEFKELISVHIYGGGDKRRVRLFYDWNGDRTKGAIGYKYMLLGYGVTKDRIITDAYDLFVLNQNKEEILCWYDVKIAETDAQRFKVPICG